MCGSEGKVSVFVWYKAIERKMNQSKKDAKNGLNLPYTQYTSRNMQEMNYIYHKLSALFRVRFFEHTSRWCTAMVGLSSVTSRAAHTPSRLRVPSRDIRGDIQVRNIGIPCNRKLWKDRNES